MNQLVLQDTGQVARLLLQRGVENNAPLPQETSGVDFLPRGRVPGEQLASMRPQRRQEADSDRESANFRRHAGSPIPSCPILLSCPALFTNTTAQRCFADCYSNIYI